MAHVPLAQTRDGKPPLAHYDFIFKTYHHHPFAVNRLLKEDREGAANNDRHTQFKRWLEGEHYCEYILHS
jgi:hypothetical protein